MAARTPPPAPALPIARPHRLPAPQERCRLDAILTLVDAKHVLRHLDEQKPEGVENEAVEQVAFADRILLNKVDLVSLAEKAEVVRRLRGINAFAEVLEATHSRFDLDKVLGVGAFDLGRVLEVRTDYYSPREDSWAWRARALCNAI